MVRVGNHPRSSGGLKRRLRDHYSGGKHGSVFRKYLGGALIRRDDPRHPCLEPAPGKGHWERQDSPACPTCRPFEQTVSAVLRSTFLFRCVAIADTAERNRLESSLVATLSLCSVCGPSLSWLGRYAYSDKVRSSGLWNSDYVGDGDLLMTVASLTRFEELVAATVPLFRS